MQHSVVVHTEEEMVVEDLSACATDLERQQLTLLGLAFCRDLPHIPLEGDLRDIKVWASSSCGLQCNRCLSTNTQTQRFDTLPSQAWAVSSVSVCDLQACTSIDVVHDCHDKAHYQPRRLGATSCRLPRTMYARRHVCGSGRLPMLDLGGALLYLCRWDGGGTCMRW